MIFKDKNYRIEVDTAGGDTKSASVRLNGECVEYIAGIRVIPDTDTDHSTVIIVLHGIYTLVDGDESRATTLLVPSERTEAVLNAWHLGSNPDAKELA